MAERKSNGLGRKGVGNLSTVQIDQFVWKITDGVGVGVSDQIGDIRVSLLTIEHSDEVLTLYLLCTDYIVAAVVAVLECEELLFVSVLTEVEVGVAGFHAHISPAHKDFNHDRLLVRVKLKVSLFQHHCASRRLQVNELLLCQYDCGLCIAVGSDVNIICSLTPWQLHIKGVL